MFTNFDLDPNFVFWLTVLHCSIGFSATAVAVRKGHNFFLWLLLGLLGGTIGLIASLRLKPVNQ